MSEADSVGAPDDASTVRSARSRVGWAATQPWLSVVARVGLGVMWLYYSVPKLSYSSDALGLAVRQYRILPAGLANTFGMVQPYLELALGLLVLAGWGTRLVAGLSAVLRLVYIGGIISLGARGIAINCGCGGIASTAQAGHTRYTLDVLRDLLYLAPALWLLRWPRSPLSADRWLLGSEPPVRG
ncbi:MAG: MauE/DoxX family redox-associated membrane protein [Actinocrinis sp.]